MDLNITHIEGYGSMNFEDIIAGAPDELVSIATKLREIIAYIYPGVIEVTWPTQKISSYGVGPKKMSEHFCYIGIQSKHVNLGFYFGNELISLSDKLEGTGKKLRHVKIRTLQDAQDEDIANLVKLSLNNLQDKLGK